MNSKKEYIATKRGYIVTKQGLLFNLKNKQIGKGLNRHGYHKFSMRINPKIVEVTLHRLQAFQKFGDKLFEKGIVTRHLDGNPRNNEWSNIAIGTHTDNMQDIPKGVRLRKANYATSFVRKYDKLAIRNFHKEGKSYKETMYKFDISSKGTLHFILNK